MEGIRHEEILRFTLLLVVIASLTACNMGNPTSPESIVALPALSLTIQAQNPASFSAGQNVNFQYTVTNVGSVRLEGGLR